MITIDLSKKSEIVAALKELMPSSRFELIGDKLTIESPLNYMIHRKFRHADDLIIMHYSFEQNAKKVLMEYAGVDGIHNGDGDSVEIQEVGNYANSFYVGEFKSFP